LVKLFGEANPVLAWGIGHPPCIVPQVPLVGQISVEVTG
jgi:hypothetical protein